MDPKPGDRDRRSKLAVQVPIWSVFAGQDWALVAAVNRRQAELLMVGRLVADLRRPIEDVRGKVRARPATPDDLETLRSYATHDKAAAAMLKLLGHLVEVDAEPDPATEQESLFG